MSNLRFFLLFLTFTFTPYHKTRRWLFTSCDWMVDRFVIVDDRLLRCCRTVTRRVSHRATSAELLPLSHYFLRLRWPGFTVRGTVSVLSSLSLQAPSHTEWDAGKIPSSRFCRFVWLVFAVVWAASKSSLSVQVGIAARIVTYSFVLLVVRLLRTCNLVDWWSKGWSTLIVITAYDHRPPQRKDDDLCQLKPDEDGQACAFKLERPILDAIATLSRVDQAAL